MACRKIIFPPDSLAFFKYEWDWRNEIHISTFREIGKDPEKIFVPIDQNELEKINKVYKLMKLYNKSLVKVHYKNEDDSISHMVDWKDFNPEKMEVVDINEDEFTKYETNILDIIKSKKAPGMFSKTDDSRGSITHKGKIDEGAIGDLLDKGLDGAMKRADQRQKNTGHAFSKSNKNRFIRRKKNGRGK